MSNELTTTTQEMSHAALAERMGIKQSEGSSTPSTSRLSQLQTAVKAMVEVNGKKMNMEAVPVGAFVLRVSEDETVYSDTVTVRMFLQREQWTRWFSDTKSMGKSVLANDVRNDLHDNMGGYNLGRPSGYIEDFNALPEATKDLVRAVKRTRVVMGLVTLDNPVNDSGDPVNKEYKDIPFIYDIKNNKSMKALDAAIKSLGRKNILPIMGTMTFSGVTDELPNGNLYGYLDVTANNELVEVGEMDYTTLDGFTDLVSVINTKIMDEHYENQDKGMSNEDAAIVGSIVDVEG